MQRPSVSNLFSLTTKRVTDLVLKESRQVFRETGIELDAKMTSIVLLLSRGGPRTSSELAAETGLSRQLVESRLRRLVDDRYLIEEKDRDDRRRRVYSLAPDKAGDVALALAMTKNFERVYEAIWAEIGVDLQRGLRDLEMALESRSVLERLGELELAAPSPAGGRAR